MWVGGHDDGWRTPDDTPAPGIDVVSRRLAPWLNGRTVLDVQLMAGGLINRNCRVRVSGMPAACVFRLYDRDRSAAAKELAILRLLRRDVPVPEVLFANTAPADNEPPFLLLELVNGTSLAEVSRGSDRDAIAAAAYDAGRLLARLQTHRFTRPGLLTADLVVDSTGLPEPLTTTSLVAHFAASPTFTSRVGVRLTDDLLRAAQGWDDHPRAPAMPTTLAHGDFNRRNVLVAGSGGACRVSAILDWEFAFAGSAYCDVGNFLRHEPADRPRFEPWFSRGLMDTGVALDGDWRLAAQIVDLPALCELLSRASTPADTVSEIAALVTETLRQAARR